MYRIAMEKLLKWKESKRRKPLIIEGARQVGKTWLMKEFGKLYYTDTVYINFDSNSRMAELFASDLDTKTTCFLADMGDFAAFNEVYARYFTGKPARSCVAVKTLPKNVLCEVEVIADLTHASFDL